MIVEKIRSWLVKARDTSNVTYSRFGRPGTFHKQQDLYLLGDPEQDDHPPPTTILVEPFDENAPEFMLFQCWHVQKASAVRLAAWMNLICFVGLCLFWPRDDNSDVHLGFLRIQLVQSFKGC